MSCSSGSPRREKPTWHAPALTHVQRPEYLRAIAEGIRGRVDDAAQIWPRESGVLHAIAQAGLAGIPDVYEFYAGLADDYRSVSELLVRDPRVDKIAFTGSTAAGKRIASICGERIARYTLELGGKSAAVILDDMDLGQAAATLSLEHGRFIEPTVFGNVDNSSTIPPRSRGRRSSGRCSASPPPTTRPTRCGSPTTRRTG